MIFRALNRPAEIAAWFDAQITHVRIGHIEHAKRALRSPWWLSKLDLDGIPQKVIDEWQACSRMALNDLARCGVRDPEPAMRWLNRALALYTDPE